jgi:hypothetical protein
MALTFPTNPNDGDTHLQGSVTYTYSSATDQWTGDTSVANPDTVGSVELKNAVQLVIYNSSGTILKSLYGAGE